MENNGRGRGPQSKVCTGWAGEGGSDDEESGDEDRIAGMAAWFSARVRSWRRAV